MKAQVMYGFVGIVAAAFAYAPAPIVFDTPAARRADLMVVVNPF